MPEHSSPAAEIDEIMRRIRDEVATDNGRPPLDEQAPPIAANDATPAAETIPPEKPASPDYPVKTEYRVEDFLAYHDEAFLRHAYRVILGRDLDEAGRSLFLEKLQAHRLSRIELLARLRYSGEGRRKAVPIRGNLALRALARSSLRIPVIGYGLASINYLVKLPLMSGSIQAIQSDLRRDRDSNADALHAAEARLQRSFAQAQDEMWKKLWEVFNKKVDKEPFWELSGQKLDRTELDGVIAELSSTLLSRTEFEDVVQQKLGELSSTLLSRTELDSVVCQTVEKDEFWRVANRKVDKEVYWQALAGKVDRTWVESKHAEISKTLAAVESRQREQKIGLLDQQRRLVLLLEEARKRMPEPLSREQVATLSAAADHWLDAHYVSFEDVFRGSREDIKQRVEEYLPVMRGADAGSEERPVVDVGCGRGELLEVLRDNGLVARGVDLNQILIEQCRDNGLDVTEADAIEYLEKLPAASVGAVTGLHIIEHIPFERLVRLLDESLRVLKPGGVVVFETPNPENLLVGACNFYYDPTHLNPLPPPVTQFLIEARGFVRVEIKRLTKNRSVETLPDAPEGPESESLNRVISFINRHFGAPPDYAVVGYKA